VHYDPTGPNAPGYDLNLLAEALDSTYKFEIDFLGYVTPPGDSATNPNIPSEEYGGDNRYDVYIGNLGSGFYGFTQFEYEVEEGSNRYTSYMMIDNDFTNYFSSGINGARITVAHEFHHSIQGGNYIFRMEDAYFYEITSTAMEEFVFDDVNDYYAYLPSYFMNPDKPMPLHNGFNLAIWNLYLKENLGYTIIKRQWELMINMRAILSIEQSLNEYATSIRKELSTFGIWTYFTNYRAIPGMYFDEASNYPIITPTTTIQFTPPSQPIQMNAGPTTNKFIKFTIPAGNHTLFAIVTNGDAIAANQNVNQLFEFQYSLFDYQEPGSTPIMNNYYYTFESQYEEYFKIVHIFNDLIATQVTDNDVITQYKLYQNYPNPFNPNTTISYSVPEIDFVTLKVYDVLGNEIVTLVNEEKPAGEHEVEFSAIGGSASGGNAYTLPSGIYFYQLKAGMFTETKKLILMK